jgi:hypothetical protein
LVPRAVDLLFTTPGGPDRVPDSFLTDQLANARPVVTDPVTGAKRVILDASVAGRSPTDVWGADEIHGSGGDDTVYGGGGNDVVFGDDGDDDLIGGWGHDWISGGRGQDGILGDDGRILTSRNPGVRASTSTCSVTTQLARRSSTRRRRAPVRHRAQSRRSTATA